MGVIKRQCTGIGIRKGGDTFARCAIDAVFTCRIFTRIHVFCDEAAACGNDGGGALHRTGQVLLIRGVQVCGQVRLTGALRQIVEADGDGRFFFYQRASAAALGSCQLHGEVQLAVLFLQLHAVIDQINFNICIVQVGGKEGCSAAYGIVGSSPGRSVRCLIIHTGHILQALAFTGQRDTNSPFRLVRPDLHLGKAHGTGNFRFIVLNGHGGRTGVGIDLSSSGFRDNDADNLAALVQFVIQSLECDLLFPFSVGKDHREGIAVVLLPFEYAKDVLAGVVIHKALWHFRRNLH